MTRKTLHSSTLALGAAALFLIAPAGAQDMTPATSADSPMSMQSDAPMMAPMSASEVDEAFVKAAAHSGLFEIQSSRMALETSDDEAIRGFARRMIEQHEALNARLKEVTRMDVPTEPGPAQKLVLAGLQGKDGAAFDEAYVKAQVHGHGVTLADFKAASELAGDEGLKAYAEEGTPLIESHLEEAMAIKERMGV